MRFVQRYRFPDAPPWYEPRYNVAPSESQMVIVERDGDRAIRAMRWGLVPFWAKDPAIGTRMINARAETVASKPAYREAFAKRRGLIVVDGYYEWRKNANGSKTPFRIHQTHDEPFTLAALWERWGHDDEVLETCTVITTPASERMQRIHERMPVVIAEHDADAWLDTTTDRRALETIIARDAVKLDAYAVTPYVNAPSHDDAMCWEPATAD